MNSQEITRKLHQIRRNVSDRSEMSLRSSRSRDKRSERSESREPDFDSSTLHKYISELSDEKALIEEKYSRYLKDPQKHPRYYSQWQEFWSVRSKALAKVGCDPQKYDFTSDWKDFFFKYLRIAKEKEIAEVKRYVHEKYAKIDKRNRNDSRSKYSRDSYKHRYYSRSPSRSRKSRSRSRTRRGHSRSSRKRNYRSHSREDPPKRIKLEPVERRRSPSKSRQEAKSPTVVSVCKDLLTLDRRLGLYRHNISKLMENAREYEKKRKIEYLMTQSEYEFLYRTKNFLINHMEEKWLNDSMKTRIRIARFQLVILIRRWEKFMQMNQKLDKAIALRQQNERKTTEWHKKNRNKAHREVHRSPHRSTKRSRRHSTDTPKSSSESTSDYKSMENSFASASNTSNVDFDFTATLLKLKKEKAEKEIEDLMQEKAELIEQIKQEEISPENSPDHSQELVIDESQAYQTGENEMDESNNNMLFGNMTDIKLSASDISNEELLDLFKDFEKSSEEELEFARQIMEEIERNDKARFECLKRAMEEIQNSYENKTDFVSYIRELSPNEAKTVLRNAEANAEIN